MRCIFLKINANIKLIYIVINLKNYKKKILTNIST